MNCAARDCRTKIVGEIIIFHSYCCASANSNHFHAPVIIILSFPSANVKLIIQLITIVIANTDLIHDTKRWKFQQWVFVTVYSADTDRSRGDESRRRCRRCRNCRKKFSIVFWMMDLELNLRIRNTWSSNYLERMMWRYH